MDKVVRVGLLGIGKMGQNHLRILNMLKNVEISFIYDTNRDISNKMANTFNVKVSNDIYEDLPGCDGVIIVTPTFTHFDYINRVSDHVKNIFVEKPLTDTIETSKIILDLAEKKSLNIQVGFIERYNSAVLTLKKILSKNKIINIDFTRTNKMSNRITDCDVVIDLMIHDIDLSIYFNGEVEHIYAHGVINNGMIEYARAVFIHKNGSFSNIVASRITEKRIRQISITTENEYIDCNLSGKEIFINKQSVEQRMDNVSISSNTETIEVVGQESLLIELMDFIKTCKSNSDYFKNNTNLTPPNQHDGMKAMEVAHKVTSLIYNNRPN